MTTDSPARPTHRIALISIAGLWGLYFTLLTIRSAAIYDEPLGMLGRRAIVTLASAVLSGLIYLVLRRIPTTRLGLSVAAAAALALPGAIAYSTINWYVFDHRGEQKAMSWKWQGHAVAPAAPTAPTPPAAQGTMTVPPAPPSPPGVTMTVGTAHEDYEASPLQSIADQASNGYFFFAAWAALYLALCYAAEVGALERRAASLRAAAQSAELRALRYQINPHFLFNTLNSLSTLVMTGKRDAAERMIINLATFFRTSLTGDPTEDVPLSEELRLQRLYLDIEAVRFPERLIAAFQVPDALLGACIPGLILQPLVENAVKYGVARARRPVTLTIRAEESADGLRLIVADDGDAEGGEGLQGTGTGLRNVRERLAARYGEAGRARWGPTRDGGFSVVLDMPLVRDGC